MNAVRGRVRGGRIELDDALPEGAEVVVLAAGPDESFDLDDAQLAEIDARMAEADRGEVEPAGAVLERLRRSR
jgi:predicted transcriptional regulator